MVSAIATASMVSITRFISDLLCMQPSISGAAFLAAEQPGQFWFSFLATLSILQSPCQSPIPRRLNRQADASPE